MKSSLVVLSMAALMSSGAFASSISFDVTIHNVLTLKKVSRNIFEKISDTSTGKASVNYVKKGSTKVLASQNINEADTVNGLTFMVEGKNILRVIDQKENIDKEIPAEINKTLFGNVKSMTIKSNALEALYADSIKRYGLDILRGLSIPGKISFNSDVTFSDQRCKKDGDLLVCTEDSNLNISLGD